MQNGKRLPSVRRFGAAIERHRSGPEGTDKAHAAARVVPDIERDGCSGPAAEASQPGHAGGPEEVVRQRGADDVHGVVVARQLAGIAATKRARSSSTAPRACSTNREASTPRTERATHARGWSK